MTSRIAALLGIVLLGPALSAQTSAPAPVAFDTYPGITGCVAAAQRALTTATWNRVFDTLPFDARTKVMAEGQAEARRCLAVLAPGGLVLKTAPDRDVASLFYLGRGLNEDSIAAAAWHRSLRMVKIRDDSTSILWHLDGAYSNGRVVDLPQSQHMARWLDSLGYIGERPMIPNDSFWISQHGDPGSLARALMDTAAMRAEIAGVRRNYASLPVNARKGAEMSPVYAQAEQLILALLANPRSDSAVALLKAKSLEMLGEQQEEEGYGGAMTLLGQHYGPIHPDFWFGRQGTDSLYPRPGHLTLVQVVNPRYCTCEYMAATLHRLKARFGDRLDIVLLAQTFGHFDGHVQLAPKDEAELLNKRIRGEWNVDVALGVYTTTFVPNPDPDRRLVPQVIPELRHIRFGNDALMIDDRGVLVLAGVINISPWGEALLNTLVESMLRNLPH